MSSTAFLTSDSGIAKAVRRNRALCCAIVSKRLGAFFSMRRSTSAHNQKSMGLRSGEMRGNSMGSMDKDSFILFATLLL